MGGFAVGAQDDVSLFGGFLVQLVVRVEVRKLPQACAEAVVFEVGDHLLGVLKTGLGELEVAAVGHLGPVGVEVDDVAGDFVLTQLLRDVPDLVFGGVALAAHPQAERPEGRDSGASGEGRVLGEDFFRRAEKDEQVEHVVAEVDHGRLAIGAAEVEREGSARVHEHAVAVAAHEERHRLVHVRRLRAVGVVGPQHEPLATLVQARERLPTPEELLFR